MSWRGLPLEAQSVDLVTHHQCFSSVAQVLIKGDLAEAKDDIRRAERDLLQSVKLVFEQVQSGAVVIE